MSCTLSTSDVLIVGAGPTGLTLAHELLRHGIKPRLIEKTPSASANSKALGVMARTLELLAASGIAREMLELGVKVPTVSIWSSGRHLARLDFAHGIDSPYPFILMIPQHTTEAILTRHVLSLGAQGMNTGMQDAYNLAWKLALVVQGRAPTNLLESYQIEREEVGMRLLQDDERLTRQAFLHHPLALAGRDCLAPQLTQHQAVQQTIATTAAELHISYHQGPLVFDFRGEKVKSVASAVKVGDRAPNGLLFTRG